MLRVEHLESGYGPMQVLWKPSLEVEKGSITSLLGPNGVGKTTLLKTILGSVEPSGGKIIYEERDITHSPTHEKVEMGIVLVPLVEQNADASLNAPDYVYIMHEGVIKAKGTHEEIKGSSEIREAYLGI